MSDIEHDTILDESHYHNMLDFDHEESSNEEAEDAESSDEESEDEIV